MFFLTMSSVWSFCLFFTFTYLTLLFSLIVYLIPISNYTNTLTVRNSRKTLFYLVSGGELSYFFFLPIFLIFLLNVSWSSSDISSWFGHLIFSSSQGKVIYLVLIMFSLVLIMFLTTTYFSSQEIYDFFITKLNFMYWLTILFFSNSIFTVMFVIEVLSTLIFLLITTSVFSTSFFYKNTALNSGNFLHNTSPYSFLQSLLFFFWVSLISSLNLFVFIILLYTNLVTFDWFLLEVIFYYYTLVSGSLDVAFLGLVWFVIVFSIFLKCGIAPLFIWKPTFFKGISFSTLAFYIVFFYFLIFLFFINFMLTYLHELFFYYSFVVLLFIVLGLLTLFFILCESFFIKTFFAVSSILNSLLVILAMTAVHNLDITFFI